MFKDAGLLEKKLTWQAVDLAAYSRLELAPQPLGEIVLGVLQEIPRS